MKTDPARPSTQRSISSSHSCSEMEVQLARMMEAQRNKQRELRIKFESLDGAHRYGRDNNHVSQEENENGETSYGDVKVRDQSESIGYCSIGATDIHIRVCISKDSFGSEPGS